MSRITIKPSQVMGSSPQLGSIASKLSSIEGGVASVRNSIDYRILARTSARPQLNEAGNSIDQLEAKVKKLQSFLNLSVSRYSSTERYLNGAFMTMEAARSMSPASPEAGGKKAESTKKKNTDPSSLVYKVLSYFNSVSSQITNWDIALVGSQVLSVASSAFLMRNLKINYIGGKPTIGQRFRGQYKFTVTAKPSWTSKTGYSSKIAKYLYDFSRSTPTNPVSKLAHSFVSSYRGPAALLKHAAGFSKNVNAAMHGTTLMGRFHKRITIGTKEVAASLAKARGFTAVANRIPMVGNIIAVAANATELVDPKNANLTAAEKIGRFTFGSVASVGAIAGGAKLGAMAGSLGGPVGIVIGGAVGGLVGGIVSSKAAEPIKKAGEKVFGAVENVGKSVFKSVKSWFD
ncbi:hypothetical protein [Bacillus timonensis]|uniref:hypothetical protein n=1 Tax=Bacillus timonensis TaxID=1033734 RepID=UPI0002890CA2|nr:hypothetical protein [Bacillus timonensis]